MSYDPFPKLRSTYHPFGVRIVELNVHQYDWYDQKDFQFRSCGDLIWRMSLPVSDGVEEKTISVLIENLSTLLPIQTCTLIYQIHINSEDPTKSITLEGEKQFSSFSSEIKLPIENFEEVFGDKNFWLWVKDNVRFKAFFAVKSTQMIDCVEAIDLFTKNESINDVKVIVDDKTELFVLKSVFLALQTQIKGVLQMLCLQSSKFESMLNTNNELKLETSEYYSLEDICDLFQLIHGVDLCLDNDNSISMLALARDFDVPRITEKCKQYLLRSDCHVAVSFLLADEFGLWDVAPTLRARIKSLKESKNGK